MNTPVKDRVIPGTIERVCMRVDHELVSDGYDTWREEKRRVAHPTRAQLVTSLIAGRKKMHAPVLDLDVPHTLVASTSEGHSHLYLDVPMTWWRYKRLLRALAKAGIIEKGYVKASLRRKHTDVRVPWLKKVKA